MEKKLDFIADFYLWSVGATCFDYKEEEIF